MTTTTTSISAELASARATLEAAKAAALAATPAAPEVLRVTVACPECGDPGLVCEMKLIPWPASWLFGGLGEWLALGWFLTDPKVVGDACGCEREFEDETDPCGSMEEAMQDAERAAAALVAPRQEPISEYNRAWWAVRRLTQEALMEEWAVRRLTQEALMEEWAAAR